MGAIAHPQPTGEMPHLFRAQMAATLRLSCPECGYVASYQIAAGQWELQCASRECRRHYTIGINIKRKRHGGQAPAELPMDRMMRTFALDPAPWRSGDPVHRVLQDDDEDDNVQQDPKRELP